MSADDEAPARELRGPLARLIPPSMRADADELRRGKLFVVVSLVLMVAAAFFVQQLIADAGSFSAAAQILSVGALIAALCIPLAWWLGSIRGPSVLLGVVNVVAVEAMGFYGIGIGDPSQWWVLPAPLIATFLVGPRVGLMVGGLAVVGWLSMFAAGDLGWRFNAPDPTIPYFHMLGSVTVIGAVAAIAAQYESARQRGVHLVEAARRELVVKNRELESTAQALAQARDRALEESRRKDEFLERMRVHAMGHGEGLERTRRASAQLSQTVRAIASSVETLASSSLSSDAKVAGMADNAGRVAASVERLVSDVGQTTDALAELTGAVAAVQAQYDHLRASAEATARAMLTVEQSASAAEAAVTKTVGLADLMIQNAERGVEAVRRTLGGVDEIRDSSRTAGTVIRDLDQRVRAIGAINNVIDEVAVETNVLALNASIIAAQAGEQGAGFRVVAGQIKALAERTAASTREIATVIRGLQAEASHAVEVIARGESAVEAGAALSEEAARALEHILASAREATAHMRDIESAVGGQAARARDVGGAMNEVTRIVAEAVRATGEHGKAAAQIEAATRRLGALGPELEHKSRTQADDAREARAAIAQISEMARRLAALQGDQTRVSEQTLRAVEEIQQAQRGQDEALRSLE